ncbi:hypothetical protein G6F37_008999 [Rhizopus arrhizus]|nr:hypothetical protein G6F38_009025 [Rhizopus arrhizus]KAG1154933.1 hypothetical protein G6F37_008999 [Rhizopus arrhizus]
MAWSQVVARKRTSLTNATFENNSHNSHNSQQDKVIRSKAWRAGRSPGSVLLNMTDKSESPVQLMALIAKQFLSRIAVATTKEGNPMRPVAIGLDVHERGPYTFLTYLSTPILSPTETSMHDVIEDGDGNTNNSDDDCDNIKSNKDAASKANDNDKTPRDQKRKFDGPAIPYCKNRILHIMKTITTNADPANEGFFYQEFVTSAIQHKIITNIFSNLHRHCNESQLQYWVGQSKIWGPLGKLKMNGKTIYGRHLWILRKEMRQFLIETNDFLSSYWQHFRANLDVVGIGYARKSVTKETDVSRPHLLQLMVDKLHFRLKCQEVYAVKKTSPI